MSFGPQTAPGILRELPYPRPADRPHEAWPTGLEPEALQARGLATPFLAIDTTVLRRRVESFRHAFAGRVDVRYAVKCNPLPDVLAAVVAGGGSFEIASAHELDLALTAGAHAADIFYSNPVKPASHIASTAAAGVRRFVVDGVGEIDKVAAAAPGAEILVRLRVGDAHSAFPLSSKFGAAPSTALGLLEYAEARGLLAAGLTFHVGSQCTDVQAWSRAIDTVSPLYSARAASGRPLPVLDLGGGFPARYTGAVPGIGCIAPAILRSLDAMPHPPTELVAEPGRSLAAEVGVLAAEVIGREDRQGRPWLFLEVGAYNGMIEAAQTGARWPYPVRVVDGRTGRLRGGTHTTSMTVTGPTCDSSDTVLQDVRLPEDVSPGDVMYLAGTGAYTLSYASSFNGFPPPTPVTIA
jgi:ornithine decarboxylase